MRGFAGVEGQILAGSPSNTDGGFFGRTFPCAVVVSYPGGQCLSHTTVVLDVGRLVLGMAFLHASFSSSLLGNLNTLSLFSSLEFPVHLGTQHLLIIVLFLKLITKNE